GLRRPLQRAVDGAGELAAVVERHREIERRALILARAGVRAFQRDAAAEQTRTGVVDRELGGRGERVASTALLRDRTRLCREHRARRGGEDLARLLTGRGVVGARGEEHERK